MSDNQKDYKYGFSDSDISVYKTTRGLSEDIIKEISRVKQEPPWMTDYRLKAYTHFCQTPNPSWGPDLSILDYDDYIYYIKASEKQSESWEDVPETIKQTFDKLGIPEAEQRYLAGVSTQYESEVVYHNMLAEVREKGVIFLDTDSALKTYPDLFREYFSTVVNYDDNKFAALNSCVWSGGSFIYLPKGVVLEKPLQSYFRINTERMGQFERTLIILEEEANLHYVEGCTAPIYRKDSLHAAVVEIIIKDRAKCRYSTVQNWSNNIINLVTKRAVVGQDATMDWVDGNLGAQINMKYPACILAGKGARGSCISIAVAGNGQIQDAGAKMIHLAADTASTIISKSIAKKGGIVNYRGLVSHHPTALNAKTKIECDTLIVDEDCSSDTLPTNIISNATSVIEHEASVSNISEDQLFYLMSRGLSQPEAAQMIILGFIEPFTRELPMEYAVELNQLLKLDMQGSIG